MKTLALISTLYLFVVVAGCSMTPDDMSRTTDNVLKIVTATGEIFEVMSENHVSRSALIGVPKNIAADQVLIEGVISYRLNDGGELWSFPNLRAIVIENGVVTVDGTILSRKGKE